MLSSEISCEWADFLVEVFRKVESETSNSLLQFFKNIGINKTDRPVLSNIRGIAIEYLISHISKEAY